MYVDEQVVVCDSHTETIVRVTEKDGENCPVCKTPMTSIGWIQHKKEEQE